MPESKHSEGTPDSSLIGGADRAQQDRKHVTDVHAFMKAHNFPPYTGHWADIYKFMKLAGQECPERPGLPSPEVRRLRAALILEEALETIEALGFNATVAGKSVHKNVELHAVYEPNFVEVLDGCADLSVVTEGTLIACGTPDRLLYHMVDLNNLAKFGPGGRRREDGKWIKPPDHRPPPIAFIVNTLERDSWTPSSDPNLKP